MLIEILAVIGIIFGIIYWYRNDITTYINSIIYNASISAVQGTEQGVSSGINTVLDKINIFKIPLPRI